MTRMLFGWLTAGMLGGVLSLEGFAQTPPPPVPENPLPAREDTPSTSKHFFLPGDPAGQPVKALVEGPLHEAFLSPAKADEPEHIKAAPPPPITERPGIDSPSPSAVWIGGYWEWDKSRNDYTWVTGTWRVPPPGRFWVNGYWKRDDQGWYRVPGFWSERQTDRLDYRKNGPPQDRPDEEPGPAPGQDYFYVPGEYVPDGDGVVWRKGYWSKVQPGWAWVPAQWIKQAEGWVFQEGYWDRVLEDRGTLFAPAAITDTGAGSSEELVYQPISQIAPASYARLYGAYGRPTWYYDGYPGCFYDLDGRYYGYANYGTIGLYNGFLDYPLTACLGYPYLSTAAYNPFGFGYGGYGYGYGGLGFGYGGGYLGFGLGLLSGLFGNSWYGGFGYPYGYGFGLGWGSPFLGFGSPFGFGFGGFNYVNYTVINNYFGGSWGRGGRGWWNRGGGSGGGWNRWGSNQGGWAGGGPGRHHARPHQPFWPGGGSNSGWNQGGRWAQGMPGNHQGRGLGSGVSPILAGHNGHRGSPLPTGPVGPMGGHRGVGRVSPNAPFANPLLASNRPVATGRSSLGGATSFNGGHLALTRHTVARPAFTQSGLSQGLSTPRVDLHQGSNPQGLLGGGRTPAIGGSPLTHTRGGLGQPGPNLLNAHPGTNLGSIPNRGGPGGSIAGGPSLPTIHRGITGGIPGATGRMGTPNLSPSVGALRSLPGNAPSRGLSLPQQPSALGRSASPMILNAPHVAPRGAGGFTPSAAPRLGGNFASPGRMGGFTAPSHVGGSPIGGFGGGRIGGFSGGHVGGFGGGGHVGGFGGGGHMGGGHGGGHR